MTSTRKHLRKARDLLADPEHWVKGAYARSQDGVVISALNKNAACWCLLGALQRATGREEDNGPTYSHVATVARTTGRFPLSDFNDHPLRQHREVLDLLDEAIAWLEP